MIALRGSLRLASQTSLMSNLSPLSPYDNHTNNHKLGVSLCSYVCAHRLVDVMALVEGRVSRVGVPKHRKQGNFGDVYGKVSCLR